MIESILEKPTVNVGVLCGTPLPIAQDRFWRASRRLGGENGALMTAKDLGVKNA